MGRGGGAYFWQCLFSGEGGVSLLRVLIFGGVEVGLIIRIIRYLLSISLASSEWKSSGLYCMEKLYRAITVVDLY